MNEVLKKIELVANLAIVAVALLLCTVLVKSYILPAPTHERAREMAETRKSIGRGDEVAISGIDWQKNGRTLLLALSSTCHFCTQSAPFYQRVVKERGDTQLVALLPQSAEEGRSYLEQLNITVADVRQASLARLGLSGTPTLILVSERGIVSDVWVGALAPSKENEVLSRLRAERASE